MSILVTDQEDKKIKLYIKGADSEIMKRLKKSEWNEESLKYIERFQQQASLNGFWVLLMAFWELDQSELETFLKSVHSAGLDLDEWEKLYEALFDDLE